MCYTVSKRHFPCNFCQSPAEMEFMRHKLLFLPFLIAIVGLSALGGRDAVDAATAAAKPAALQGPVVVELFTSQSCSSCPPADALLGELVQDANVIGLSCHVTYWDHLNWRDTLSRKFCTDRQRAYAGFMGSRQVYTPQMVVNGEHGFVGSNRQDATRYMATRTVLPIALEKTATGLRVTLPPLPTGSGKQTLWLLRHHDAHTQNIRSGENRGKTITYTNSVEALEQVGVWQGDAQTLDLPALKGEAANPGYTLIAQPMGFGPISAAGRL